MKRKYILMLLLFSFTSCSKQSKNENLTYKWSSYPAFHKGFDIELIPGTNEIVFSVHTKLLLADTLGENYYGGMASASVERIRDLIPKKTRIKSTIPDNISNEMKTILSKLCTCDQEDMRGLDGITHIFTVFDGNELISECSYFSPDENSERGKAINNLMEILVKNYDRDLMISNTLENSKLYMFEDIPEIQIRNIDPLYIKIIDLPWSCESVQKDVDKLPKAKDIFIDLTNYQGKNEHCYATSFYNKYEKV